MGLARQALDREYHLLNSDKGNLGALKELLAGKLSIYRPGADLRSPDDLIGFLSAFMTALPDANHEFTTVIESGDTIAFEGVGKGTFTQTLRTPQGPVPPNGNKLSLRFSGVIKVDGSGKIVHDAIYFDQIDMLTQLGLMPAPASA